MRFITSRTISLGCRVFTRRCFSSEANEIQKKSSKTIFKKALYTTGILSLCGYGALKYYDHYDQSHINFNKAEINGTTTILQNIDKIIEQKKGIDINSSFVEYLYTKPDWNVRRWNLWGFNFNSYSAGNYYGHSALRLKTSTFDVTVNINQASPQFIAILQTQAYLFERSTHTNDDKDNMQGGIFARSYVGVRVYVDEEEVKKVYEYYLSLMKMVDEGKLKFSLLGHVWKKFKTKTENDLEQGNCSYWISKALEQIDIVKITNYPLVLLFKILYNEIIVDNTNKVIVIAYNSLNYQKEPHGATLYPFYGLRRRYGKLWYLHKSADIIITPTMCICEDQENQIDKYELIITTNDKALEWTRSLKQKMESIGQINNDIKVLGKKIKDKFN